MLKKWTSSVGTECSDNLTEGPWTMLESEKKYERTGKKFEKGVQNADCVRFLRANVRSACGCHTHTHTHTIKERERKREKICVWNVLWFL